MRRLVGPVLVASLAAACTDDAPPTCRRLCTPPAWNTLALLAGRPGGPGAVDGTAPAAHFLAPWTGTLDGHGRLDLPGASVTTIAGTPLVRGNADGIGAAASFSLPKAVVLDEAQDYLYIVDNNNMSVRRLALSDDAVTTVATFPTQPVGIAVDGA